MTRPTMPAIVDALDDYAATIVAVNARAFVSTADVRILNARVRDARAHVERLIREAVLAESSVHHTWKVQAL